MIRKTLLAIVLFALFMLSGCMLLDVARQAADQYLTPGDDGKSTAQHFVEGARPFLPPPYGEIGLFGVIALQNAVLAAKKLEQRKNGKAKEN